VRGSFTVVVQVFIVYSQYIRCYRVLEGYVASRLTMSNKVYMLQVFDDEDLKLLSKIITILFLNKDLCNSSHIKKFGKMLCFSFRSALVNISARLSSVA